MASRLILALPLALLALVPLTTTTRAANSDGDQWEDEVDNCVNLANDDQRDTNLDGFGNACDADYDNDGVVGAIYSNDYWILNAAFGSQVGDTNWNPDVDCNGDGVIGSYDSASCYWPRVGTAPGASGLSCANEPQHPGGLFPCPCDSSSHAFCPSRPVPACIWSPIQYPDCQYDPSDAIQRPRWSDSSESPAPRLLVDRTHGNRYTIVEEAASGTGTKYWPFARLLGADGAVLVENGGWLSSSCPAGGCLPRLLDSTSADVLVIAGPTTAFSSAEIDAIEEWVESGHGLFLTTDPHSVNDPPPPTWQLVQRFIPEISWTGPSTPNNQPFAFRTSPESDQGELNRSSHILRESGAACVTLVHGFGGSGVCPSGLDASGNCPDQSLADFGPKVDLDPLLIRPQAPSSHKGHLNSFGFCYGEGPVRGRVYVSSNATMHTRQRTEVPYPHDYGLDVPDPENGTQNQNEQFLLTVMHWLAGDGGCPGDPDPVTGLPDAEVVSDNVVKQCSPDVPITTAAAQLEPSVFIDPRHSGILINSNNSITSSSQGADHFLSSTAGRVWQGSVSGIAGPNAGDPSTAIDLDGRVFIGHMTSGSQFGPVQNVAYADLSTYPNQFGSAFTRVTVSGEGTDKSHMWVDNGSSSPHARNLYLAWMLFGQIRGARSEDSGLSWIDFPDPISDTNHLGKGVNLQTGPGGELYAVWNSPVTSPTRLGFNRSTTAGDTWHGNSFAAENLIVRDFPSMTVDQNGDLHVVWSNQGAPGVNTGDVDIFAIKSTDEGNSWSAPVRVNQDAIGNGKDQRRPWIAADPVDGDLAVIFYDSRNSLVGNDTAQAFVAVSRDGGSSWEDLAVSDQSFSYASVLVHGNDYIGIDLQDGRVYPVWTDARTGTSLAYTSPFLIADASGDRDGDTIPDDSNPNDGQAPGGAPCVGGATSNCDDNCVLVSNADQVDADSDGIGDACDNCGLAANTPPWPYAGASAQLDVDLDGIGNRCDGDFNQDGVVGIADFNTLTKCTKGIAPSADPRCLESDLDGNGVVDQTDLDLLSGMFGNPPGPSGLSCVGTVPCAAK